MSWIIATGNEHKRKEFEQILAPLGVTVEPATEVGLLEVTEWGETFAENAVIKALEWAIQTRRVCAADDSGLEVRGLDWAPGVISARYAGAACDDEQNNKKLLDELAGVGGEGREARYRCVIAIAWPVRGIPTPDLGERQIKGFGPNECGRIDDYVVRTYDGICLGTIATERKGDGGFGYDPYFVTLDGRHMAELSDDEKHAISHRGAALRKAAADIASIPLANGSHLL
ncbi:MAG: XTP/dITP diphosphohydrolase [Flavobacteriales bacterium]|jgi:XTP/dITP diphosphohydrolase